MTAWRIGTSSWSDTDWIGPFYPPGTKAGDMLRVYAGAFDAVECDATYYRVPSAAMVRGWAAKTPESFRLSAKFPRSIVHGGSGPSPDASSILDSPTAREDCARFLEAIELLGPRRGPLLLQFPYFNRSAFASPEPFLARLDAFLGGLPRGIPIAVEVRNKAWVGEPLLSLLRTRGAAFALAEIAYMPPPWELAARFDLVTADFLYARLIGDRQATEAACERFDRVALDKSEGIERHAALLVDLAPRAREVHAFANNHYQGHGPATARALRQAVEARLAR